MSGFVSRHRLVVLAVVAVLAVAAVGGGVAWAVNLGTVGELNYVKETYTVQGTSTQNHFTRRANCPRARHVTGGGFEVSDSFVLSGEDPRPIDNGSDTDAVPDDGWAATAEIGAGNTGELTVYAICDD